MIKNRSELLFLYDVTSANPSGDPSDENKPRIDEETGINIVTDVRKKRTIRDYFFNYKGFNGKADKDIFVRQTPSKKGKGLQDGKNRALDFGKTKEEIIDNILSRCIDIRLFGAVIPLDKGSVTYTGPVQFKMGHSLHKVEMKYIKGTGAFAANDGKSQQTFREEYLLPYSLIAFYGVINENAAKETTMCDADVELLKEGLWNGTKNLLTRSKMGHVPRLMMRVEYKEPNFFIGELDKFISLKTDKKDEEIRDIEEVEIDLTKLVEQLKLHESKIEKVELKTDARIKLIGKDNIPKLVEI